MDIISLGVATKAAMEEGKTRKQTLEIGVKGSHDNVAERLEVLEQAYGNSVKKANELIIKDAMNIMKANARLNVIAQSKKYKMENMIFDDLLDLSGIDIANSNGYTHDSIKGVVSANQNCKIETREEALATSPKCIFLSVLENRLVEEEQVLGNIEGIYSITTNGGLNWQAVIPNSIVYMDNKVSLAGKQVKIKMELPEGIKILHYGLTWA